MEREQGQTGEKSAAEHSKLLSVKLEEQSRIYAYDAAKRIKGILEIKQAGNKVKIILNINNIRACSGDDKIYKLFFIGRKDGSSVYRSIGEIYPDRQGVCEAGFVVDPADIDGKGTGLSCFYIFLVAAVPVTSDSVPMQPVLKGDIKLTGSIEQKNVKTQTLYGQHKESKSSSHIPVTRQKAYNDYYKKYIMDKTSKLIGLKESFIKVLPFDKKWIADDWYRVTDVMQMPAASEGAEVQFQKYGHFLFAHDEKYFFLAVPGKHTENEWPDKGTSGFCMWQSIKNSQEYGYWCMVIDWKMGIITEIS